MEMKDDYTMTICANYCDEEQMSRVIENIPHIDNFEMYFVEF